MPKKLTNIPVLNLNSTNPTDFWDSLRFTDSDGRVRDADSFARSERRKPDRVPVIHIKSNRCSCEFEINDRDMLKVIVDKACPHGIVMVQGN